MKSRKDSILKRLYYLLEMIYAEFLLSKSFKGDDMENIVHTPTSETYLAAIHGHAIL